MLEFNSEIDKTLEKEYEELFEDCVVRDTGDSYKEHMFVDFPNGYSASIVKGRWAYGVKLPVIHSGEIVYDTPITDNVVGFVPGLKELLQLCKDIKALPERS